jgi:hypothetical protein
MLEREQLVELGKGILNIPAHVGRTLLGGGWSELAENYGVEMGGHLPHKPTITFETPVEEAA